MKSFERLVEDKNRVIKDCDDFIKELKDISLQTSSISALIELLLKKKEKYLELKYDNYKELALSVENLDEKIYRQIVILEKQGIFESGDSRKKSNKLLKLKNILKELETADIKKYDNYLNNLKHICDDILGNNVLTLIELLKIDIKNYKKGILQNHKVEISEQLILIKQNYVNNFNESSMYVAEDKKLKITLDKFCIEYKEQEKIRFFIEKANFIKNHYKSLVALLGLTPFIIYFVFNKNIGYIPMPESGDIFSLLVSLALAGLSLLFILYLMPILQLTTAFYIRDIKDIFVVFISSVFLSGLLIILILKNCSFISEKSELFFFIFYFIDTIFIFLYLCFFLKIPFLEVFKNERTWLMAFHGLISMFSPFVIFLLIYSQINQRSLFDILYLLIFIIFIALPILYALVKTKDIYFFKYLFYIFIIVSLVLLVTLSDKIVQISDLGNIKYKYLSIEKSIKETLPVEICNKDCNVSKTYYNEKEADNIIKIYNIKALSTLGKFYYLEADSNTTDKKIKFKLDAGKITPGPIIER